MKNDLKTVIRDFRPALRFLVIFIATYVGGNLIYGLFVESYGRHPDTLTKWVAAQSAMVITILSEPVEAVVSEKGPNVLLTLRDRTVLSVFEGCNGVNVMIVFTSFLVAFGGRTRSMIGFLLIGCLTLHVTNLARLTLLYFTAIYRPTFFYYFHKYFFTAGIYLVVFALWYEWTRLKKTENAPAQA